jgi:hypothetical protein
MDQIKSRAARRAGYRTSSADRIPVEQASHPAHPAHPVILPNLLPIDVFIIHHGNDFTPVCENQKTYRRLFGMIFFGGFGSLLIPNLQ